jgi:hypothetical protein
LHVWSIVSPLQKETVGLGLLNEIRRPVAVTVSNVNDAHPSPDVLS